MTVLRAIWGELWRVGVVGCLIAAIWLAVLCVLSVNDVPVRGL